MFTQHAIEIFKNTSLGNLEVVGLGEEAYSYAGTVGNTLSIIVFYSMINVRPPLKLIDLPTSP